MRAAELSLTKLIAGTVQGNETHFSARESKGDGRSDVKKTTKYIPFEYIRGSERESWVQ